MSEAIDAVSKALDLLPQWKCHKVVRAAKVLEWSRPPDGLSLQVMLEGGQTRWLNPERLGGHDSPVGGYFIEYEGGTYCSWSPSKTFEDGYTLVGPAGACVDPGHRYVLSGQQQLQFVKKVRYTNASTPLSDGELVTVAEGTTNEELLGILIDRMQYLQAQVSCRENAVALTHLETALLWLNKRTADREARKVEGTAAA